MNMTRSPHLPLAICALYSALAMAASAAQFGRPSATPTPGTWTVFPTTSTRHEAIDEAVQNGDTDYISTTNTGGDSAYFSLSAVSDPQTSSGHIIRVTAKASGTGATNLEQVSMRLYTSGGTEITNGTAYQTVTRGAYTTYSYTLTATQANNITDYAQLRIRVQTRNIAAGEYIRVTQAEFEVPDAPTAPVLSAPTAPFAQIDTTSALLGATLDATGGMAVTSRGTVFGATTNPTGNALAEGGTATGTFAHARTGLASATHYYFRGYAVNSIGTGYSPNGEFWTEPLPATAANATAASPATLQFTWTSGNGTGRLVVARAGAPVSAQPVDGVVPAASAVFGGGADLGGGNFVVYAGTGSSVTLTGLAATTTYHIAVYEFAGAAALTNYQQDTPALASAATVGFGPPVLTTPTAPGASITTTSASLGAYILSDGGAALSERGTLWGTTPAPLTNGLSEGGLATGAFSHARPGLTAATHYYFRGYAINAQGTGYSPDGEFYTEPAGQAASVVISSVTPSGFKISWTPGADSAGSIVVLKAASAANAAPVDGVAHAAGAAFGSGDPLGSGNFVVYRGSGSSVTVTGLTSNTPYYAAVYSYSGSGVLINYQQDTPATGTKTTSWLGHNGVYSIDCKSCHFLHTGAAVSKGAAQEAVCKTCHNPTGVAQAMADVQMHPITGSSTPVDCGSCHDVHNGSGTLADLTTFDSHTGVTAMNRAYIRVATNAIPGSIEAVFHDRPGDFAFGSGARNGLCQACHQTTDFHRNNNTGDYTHNLGQDCTVCHKHKDGFKPTGGCTVCHATAQDNSDGAPTRRAVVGEFALTAHHVKGGAVTDDDCAVCHYESVDISYHKNNQVDLRDPDDGSSRISFTSFTRNTASKTLESWVTDVQNRFCMHCHDADGATSTAFNTPLRPFSSNTKDAMNVFTQMNPANPYHHAVRAAGSNPYCAPSASNGNRITMVAPWNQTATHDPISCFDCHAANGHGNANQRMILTAIDFDSMLNSSTPTTALGTSVETFCGRCHKSSVYVTASNPTTVGSRFSEHGAGKEDHTPAQEAKLGCMSCHAGTRNLSGQSTYSNGAAPGAIHGGNFVWPAGAGGSYANAPTDAFLMGGYLRGWYRTTNGGSCTAQCHGSETYP